jgi:hypothetical protein
VCFAFALAFAVALNTSPLFVFTGPPPPTIPDFTVNDIVNRVFEEEGEVGEMKQNDDDEKEEDEEEEEEGEYDDDDDEDEDEEGRGGGLEIVREGECEGEVNNKSPNEKLTPQHIEEEVVINQISTEKPKNSSIAGKFRAKARMIAIVKKSVSPKHKPLFGKRQSSVLVGFDEASSESDEEITNVIEDSPDPTETLPVLIPQPAKSSGQRWIRAVTNSLRLGASTRRLKHAAELEEIKIKAAVIKDVSKASSLQRQGSMIRRQSIAQDRLRNKLTLKLQDKENNLNFLEDFVVILNLILGIFFQIQKVIILIKQ